MSDLRRGAYGEGVPLSFAGWTQFKTQCQDEFRIPSGRTQKLKVAKWCWKQQNEHNLMYIYHKQCENMQKIQ